MKTRVKTSFKVGKPKKFSGIVKTEPEKKPQKTTTTFANRKNQPFGMK